MKVLQCLLKFFRRSAGVFGALVNKTNGEQETPLISYLMTLENYKMRLQGMIFRDWEWEEIYKKL